MPTLPKPLLPLDPDPSVRAAAMDKLLRERTSVCICNLSLMFHLGKRWVSDAVERLVAAGQLSETAWGGEKVYTASNEQLDLKGVMALVADIEFARSILKEVFPDLKEGVPLCDQGDTGRKVKRVLRACVGQLVGSGLLPAYWTDQDFNAPPLC